MFYKRCVFEKQRCIISEQVHLLVYENTDHNRLCNVLFVKVPAKKREEIKVTTVIKKKEPAYEKREEIREVRQEIYEEWEDEYGEKHEYYEKEGGYDEGEEEWTYEERKEKKPAYQEEWEEEYGEEHEYYERKEGYDEGEDEWAYTEKQVTLKKKPDYHEEGIFLFLKKDSFIFPPSLFFLNRPLHLPISLVLLNFLFDGNGKLIGLEKLRVLLFFFLQLFS